MTTIRPRDVIEAINLIYPTGLDGTGVIPLSDETVADLQNILNLVQQIPPSLLPPQPDRAALDRSTTLIREGIARAQSREVELRTHGFSFSLVPDIREDGGRNPLAVLRDVLSRCPQFTPKELRRKLLELMALRENW